MVQEYLEEQLSPARLIYLQYRVLGLSPQQAEELADQDLYPEPETSEEEGTNSEG
jgi:hypothetical protein